MSSPNTTQSLALISQYLYTVQIGQDKAFNGGTIYTNRDTVLYMQRKALDYGINQLLSGLQGVANNVFALIGGKLQLANEILVSGGGGIIVPPSGNSGAGLTPFPINVTISSGEAGSSILQSNSWKGLQDVNTVVINQSILQKDAQFQFNSVTGSFDFTLYGYILQVNDVVSSFGFMPV